MKLSLALLLVALVLQAAAASGSWWISAAAYGEPRVLGEDLELPLTYAALVLAGPLALAFVLWSTARMLHRVRPWVALPVVLLLCLPSMLCGVFVSFTLGCLRGLC